ncbi:MAG: DUF4112 domain-containing protein [Deltaproteobacteria bacterium]|nr:DUF4112 domain-containing protein [Deltaproteobacteria bacterium]
MSEQAAAAGSEAQQVELARVALERAPLPTWAKRLVSVLDDGVRIPGTKIGIGLDPILGALLPVVGDAVTGAGSASLLLLALKERVPAVVLMRMVINIGVDTLVGSVPVLGDLFDAFYRSNRKNLDLIEKHRGAEIEPGAADYAVVGLGFFFALLSVVLPILSVVFLGASVIALVHQLFGG